jgi:antitoxin component of MazEF toxin-antitoxin module
MTVSTGTKGDPNMSNQKKGPEARTNARIRKKGQITISKDLLTALGAEEGDEIEFKVENGKLIGIPVVAVRIPKSQAWYWSNEWQAEERQVDQWIENGGLDRVSAQSADELIAELTKRMKKD